MSRKSALTSPAIDAPKKPVDSNPPSAVEAASSTEETPMEVLTSTSETSDVK